MSADVKVSADLRQMALIIKRLPYTQMMLLSEKSYVPPSHLLSAADAILAMPCEVCDPVVGMKPPFGPAVGIRDIGAIPRSAIGEVKDVLL